MRVCDRISRPYHVAAYHVAAYHVAARMGQMSCEYTPDFLDLIIC